MRTLQEILQSTSDVLFPAELGEREVSLDSQDCNGYTPLHVLAWRGDSAGAKALIAAGAAPDGIGDMGETPLHVAVRQENSELVEALLEAGANPDIRSEFGKTPREMAAAKSDAVARLLGRAAPNSSFKPNPLGGSV
ncbi:ankyrin repeat domain-containing protein [Pseudoxanthomonas sp. PXM02]|nr:ankyrin repeat domain-containing protein [Pseudoxanthomonas sp. PXM02]